ncbi:MAG: hypothetical protein ABIR06_20480 [Cyclobacteriaceae bacterium]
MRSLNKKILSLKEPFFILLTVISGQSFAQTTKPIVDLRFEAEYLQIGNSVGDEWAPTWAADGELYTVNDDGQKLWG